MMEGVKGYWSAGKIKGWKGKEKTKDKYIDKRRNKRTNIGETGQERNWVPVTNSNFRIPISLQPDVVNLWHFKPRLFWSRRIYILKYLGSTISGRKDKGIGKSEFVKNTQFP